MKRKRKMTAAERDARNMRNARRLNKRWAKEARIAKLERAFERKLERRTMKERNE